MNFLHQLATMLLLLACVGIALCCICRLNASDVTKGRVTLTQMMYLAFAFWAFDTFSHFLRSQTVPEACDMAVAFGLSLYLYITYKRRQEQRPRPPQWDHGHAATDV